MEIVVGIWLVINIVFTIIQLMNIFEDGDIEYSIWESIPMFVVNAWVNIEEDYNLTGRIIAVVFLSILTLPAIIATAALVAAYFITCVLPAEIFYFIFKKR